MSQHGSLSDKALPYYNPFSRKQCLQSRGSGRTSKQSTSTIHNRSIFLEDLRRWYIILRCSSNSQASNSSTRLRKITASIAAGKSSNFARRRRKIAPLRTAVQGRPRKSPYRSIRIPLNQPVYKPKIAMPSNSRLPTNTVTSSTIEPSQTPPTPPASGSSLHSDITETLQDVSDSSSLLSLLPDTALGLEGSVDGSKAELLETTGATKLRSPIRRSRRSQSLKYYNENLNVDAPPNRPAKRRKVRHLTPDYSIGSILAAESSGLRQSQSFDDISSSSSNSQNGKVSCLHRSNRRQRFTVPEQGLSIGPVKPHPPKQNLPKRLKSKDKPELELEIESSFFAKITGHPLQGEHIDEQVKENCGHFQSSQRSSNAPNRAVQKTADPYPGPKRQNHVSSRTHGYTTRGSSNAAQPGSNRGSEAPSPTAKATRSGNSGRGGRNQPRGNKGNRGRNGGTGAGRDRDSPEPPHKPIMTSDDRNTLSHVRQRQAELRRVFALLGIQQQEALQLLATRSLTKLHKRLKAHTKPVQYTEVTDDLEAKKQDIQSLATHEYEMKRALAEEDYEAQRKVIESRFLHRVEEAQREHVKGAQGDLVIFRKAHLTAGDETRTDNGSDIEPYFPRYHEMPEPDTRPRGYSSMHIQDEKPFKDHLASYDEQAQQEVIDDEIVSPVVQSVAEQIARRKAEQQKQIRFEELLSVTSKELERTDGYLVPRPTRTSENPQFALSRLADCAEYVSRNHPADAHIRAPATVEEVRNPAFYQLDKMPPSNQSEAPALSNTTAQPPSLLSRKAVPQRQKSISFPAKQTPKDEDVKSQSSSNTSTPLPAIAPAPIRMPPPPPITNHQYHPHYLPSMQKPVLPSSSGPASIPPIMRQPTLTPLITSRPTQASPPSTPVYASTPGGPANIPPPPSPSSFQSPIYGYQYPPQPQPQPRPPMSQSPITQTFPPPTYPPPQPVLPFDRSQLSQSPVESNSPDDLQLRRSSVSGYGVPRPRVGGPRREPGQITFTPTQTPNSERFRTPAQPHVLPPGQSVYRPSSLQPQGPNGTGKITNTFVNAAPDANTRAQQAADAARQNATRNQVQGAGPRGGRRVLLPKHY